MKALLAKLFEDTKDHIKVSALNFKGATVTKQSDNVTVEIDEPDLTAYLDKATYDPASGNKQVAFSEDITNLLKSNYPQFTYFV
jgi:hypothetical protein